MLISFFFFLAVWRHVLGANDAIDGIDIAMTKCTDARFSYQLCCICSCCCGIDKKNDVAFIILRVLLKERIVKTASIFFFCVCIKDLREHK